MTNEQALKQRATKKWEQAQQDYLEAMIQQEAAAIFLSAGLGRSAKLVDCAAKLDMTFDEIGELARNPVLERMEWKP